MSLTRRQFLMGASISGLACGTVAATSSFTTSHPTIERPFFSSPNLPREFDGFRIGFLTDLHISSNVPTEWIVEAVKTTVSHGVDLLLLGGDYVTIHDDPISRELEQRRNSAVITPFGAVDPEKLFEQLGVALAECRAPYGSFGVLGNHDLWVSGLRSRSTFGPSPVTLLINETRSIKRGDAQLEIHGTDDYWNGQPSFGWPFGPRNTSKTFRLLLTHNPDFAALALDRKEADFDLALCGHTHGGQIKIPLLGALVSNIKHLELIEGLYHGPANKAVYTSRGLGVVGLPFRMNCPPEITILELRSL